MQEIFEFLTPLEAFEVLKDRISNYYRKYDASYSGNPDRLKATALANSFWQRSGKSKIHVPIAADISATSADLLFGEEPRITCHDDEHDEGGSDKQKRLDFILSQSALFPKLAEAAETASALGEVYLKVTWDVERLECPNIVIIQADSALPEYRFGTIRCIHFFTVIKTVNEKVFRLYERYEEGRILNAVFLGSNEKLGSQQDDSMLMELGLIPITIPPVSDMLAVHIPNMKPSRENRSAEHGRSDYEGLRGMMDALDEAYTSWLRDIRLAKSRLIVPAEYLRRKNADLFKEGSYTYEFDEDVETLVALDINIEAPGSQAITPSQFEIRSDEHRVICENLITSIVSMAGYSPQTFGLNIDGNAQSGTALHIREKKSTSTKGKKEKYFKAPLEALLTAVVRLDAHLYPGNETDDDDHVRVSFPDAAANDLSNTAASIEMLNRAAAVSTETKVKMLHPDWSGKQVEEEVLKIKDEQGMNMDAPNVLLGDFVTPPKVPPNVQREDEPEEESYESGGEG